MKRLPLIAAGLVLFGGYLLALSWTGSTFASYALLSEPLTLDKIEPVQAQMGERVRLELTGSGFDKNSRLSLVVDAHNREAVVGRLPIPGYPTDMVLIGKQLYIANMYEGMQILDVSDPLRPEFQGRYYNNNTVLDLEPVGEYLALSCGVQGIKIAIKTENAARPIRSIHWPGVVTESKFFADHLYVAAHKDGILVYDLANPQSEKLVQQIDVGQPIKKLLVYRNHLYVSAGKEGLHIYDLSKPAAPKLVKKISAVNRITDIAIHRGELYLIDGDVGVRRYSLNDPVNPKHFQMLDIPGSYYWLSITENNLVLADKHYGLLTVPLGQEMQRNAYGQLDIGSNPKAKLMVGDYLYVGLNRDGLFVIDLSKVKPEQHLLSVAIPGRTYDLVKDGSWLYVATNPSGFQVVDLVSGSVVATLPETELSNLKQEGKTVFLRNRNKELIIVDVSTPHQPRVIHRMEFSTGPQNMSVSGSKLVTVGSGGVRLYDLTDMLKPQLLDHFQLKRATDAVIDGNNIYVAADQQGLVVLEISNGNELHKINSIKPPWPMDDFASAQALVLKGNIVYLANGESGLFVVDVKDPQQLKIASTLKLPGISNGISIAGDFLTVSSLFEGIHYIDISKPHQPKLLSTIRTKGASPSLLLEKERIYYVDRYRGVRVLPTPLLLTQVDILSTSKLKVELPAVPNSGRYNLQITNGREYVVTDGVVNYLPPEG